MHHTLEYHYKELRNFAVAKSTQRQHETSIWTFYLQMLLLASVPFDMIYSSQGNLLVCAVLHPSVKTPSAIQADGFKYTLKEI